MHALQRGSFGGILMSRWAVIPARTNVLRTMRRLQYGIALLVCLGCGGTPVIESLEGRKVAEALYTAVTSQKPELLDRTDQRLMELKSAGKLSEAAFARLTSISQRAREGNGRAAAEELDQLIRRQPAGPGH